MKNKKCKACDGKGFKFETITKIKDTGKYGFGLYEDGVKLTCIKCFGKGVK